MPEFPDGGAENRLVGALPPRPVGDEGAEPSGVYREGVTGSADLPGCRRRCCTGFLRARGGLATRPATALGGAEPGEAM